MFERIRRWYDKGLWTRNMIYDAVIKGVLTSEQADEILNRTEENDNRQGSQSPV